MCWGAVPVEPFDVQQENALDGGANSDARCTYGQPDDPTLAM